MWTYSAADTIWVTRTGVVSFINVTVWMKVHCRIPIHLLTWSVITFSFFSTKPGCNLPLYITGKYNAAPQFQTNITSVIYCSVYDSGQVESRVTGLLLMSWPYLSPWPLPVRHPGSSGKAICCRTSSRRYGIPQRCRGWLFSLRKWNIDSKRKLQRWSFLYETTIKYKQLMIP